MKIFKFAPLNFSETKTLLKALQSRWLDNLCEQQTKRLYYINNNILLTYYNYHPLKSIIDIAKTKFSYPDDVEGV